MKLGIVLRILFHVVGLSCLAGAVFVGLLVFYDTSFIGVFYGMEENHLISFIEFFCMLYAVTYLTFLATHTIINYIKGG